MRIGMVVLGGGTGRRIGRPVPKQFLLLGGKPIVIHVLEKLRTIPEIEDIVITCPASHVDAMQQLLDNHRLGPRFRCVVGGDTRQASAYLGLRALDESIDLVVIHEAVRPLVSTEDFRRLIEAPDRNVIYGIPIPFTVLKGHDHVEELLEREELVNVQLPQKFDRARLLDAHRAASEDGTEFTEDASLFFRYTGEQVRILPGSDQNIKITVPTDTVVAEAIYADLIGRRTR